MAALDLRDHAIAARAVAARIVGLADRRGAVMPGKGIAPAPTLAAQAIGPDRGIFERGKVAARSRELRRGAQQPGDLGTSFRADICECDLRRHPVTVPAPSMRRRSEEHTSELQSLMRISYAVFCLKKNKKHTT